MRKILKKAIMKTYRLPISKRTLIFSPWVGHQGWIPGLYPQGQPTEEDFSPGMGVILGLDILMRTLWVSTKLAQIYHRTAPAFFLLTDNQLA